MTNVAAPQVVYNERPANAVAGMLGHSEPGRRIRTGYVEESAGLKVGRFVCKGTNQKQVRAIAAAGDLAQLAGVTMLETMRMPQSAGWEQYAAVPLLRGGCTIWMEAAAAIDENDDVYVVHSGADAGLVQGAAGGGPAATIVPNGAAKCLKGGGDGDLVLIEVNLP